MSIPSSPLHRHVRVQHYMTRPSLIQRCENYPVRRETDVRQLLPAVHRKADGPLTAIIFSLAAQRKGISDWGAKFFAPEVR